MLNDPNETAIIGLKIMDKQKINLKHLYIVKAKNQNVNNFSDSFENNNYDFVEMSKK